MKMTVNWLGLLIYKDINLQKKNYLDFLFKDIFILK